jgi:hypothetical protein
MTSREVFEKVKCENCQDREVDYPGEGYDIPDCDDPDCYINYLEEQNKLMLEALKVIDESINDNCISDAQMMIKNIIKHVSGEQEG